ncbi:MAG: UbiD family decarboxylase [Thermoplasmata archaeon]|nr:MAG: UbiD family decarboxylase [Thermoplasmata archaeon]
MMLFRDFIRKLEEIGILTLVDEEVNPDFEVARRIHEQGENPVMFTSVKGSKFPVAANICSNRKLLSIALGIEEGNVLKTILSAIENPKPPETTEKTGYMEMDTNLDLLPVPKFYPTDGGRYITAGVVVCNDEEYGLNASYHRAMVIGKDRIVMRILPRDFHKYIERGNKRFLFCIGNPIPVIVSAAISVEIDKSELDIANSLYPIRLMNFDGIPGPEAEIVMVCEITGEEHDEGPFVDITQTLDIVRKQPVAEIKKIFVKKDAIFHAILPGGYEHRFVMGMPREATIYKEVSKVCDVVDVSLTPGGCSWLHGVVSIRKRHEDDGRKAIEYAFKGHKSMKHVFIVDDDIDIRDPSQLEWAMATRFQGDRDMVIKREKGSSLDPSADPITRETTKIGFDLTVPWGKDKRFFRRVTLQQISKDGNP